MKKSVIIKGVVSPSVRGRGSWQLAEKVRGGERGFRLSDQKSLDSLSGGILRGGTPHKDQGWGGGTGEIENENTPNRRSVKSTLSNYNRQQR